MPRDGRGHYTHVIYAHLYNHSRALISEIDKLKPILQRSADIYKVIVVISKGGGLFVLKIKHYNT